MDSTLVQQGISLAHFDDFGNNIIRPEDGALYGAINRVDFQKAISYPFPIMKTAVPNGFTIHPDYQVEERIYFGKTTIVTLDPIE